MALLGVLLLVACDRPTIPTTSSIVEFCQLPVRRVLRQGNATFQIGFAFVVSKGRPTHVRTVDNPANLDAEIGEACIGRWQLGFVPDGSDARATFQWRHGFGWESVELSWNGNTLRIPITGEDPYREDLRERR